MSYYEFHVARRYVQFEGALREFGNYASLVGQKLLILTACDPVREMVESRIREGLSLPAAACMNPALAQASPRYARYVPMAEQFDCRRRDMRFQFYDLGERPVSEENVRQVAEMARAGGFDTIVGVGGGKGQDFARAVTHFLPVKVILVPTLCATNASISTLSVLYTPDGKQIQQYWRMDNAPDLVLVDTELLLQNPPSVLSAGIGDITATYYEALCNLRMGGNAERLPLFAQEGVALAARILRENAPAALAAMRAHRANRAFESVLSMIMHNPGPLGMICLTGYAHIVDEMFLGFDHAHRIPHGLRVGYAVFAMLAAEEAEESAFAEYLAFCRGAGIPISLEALGLQGRSRAEWESAYDNTVGRSGSIHSMPFAADKNSLIQSVLDADAKIRRMQ